ncbi:UNVERIFIED_CONTAM: hypothetical protein HHA_449880 [Hammondia hammondi]|eukprot:XP_008882575.1 hypothetical protein HHA_449880 [Hammondia hammondi]
MEVYDSDPPFAQLLLLDFDSFDDLPVKAERAEGRHPPEKTREYDYMKGIRLFVSHAVCLASRGESHNPKDTAGGRRGGCTLLPK